MNNANKSRPYQVVAGTKARPGRVLAEFTAATHKRPATACLAWFAKNADAPGAEPMFFWCKP